MKFGPRYLKFHLWITIGDLINNAWKTRWTMTINKGIVMGKEIRNINLKTQLKKYTQWIKITCTKNLKFLYLKI